MIQFSKFVLDNGLKVVVNEDSKTPLVNINVLYDVGSRDESYDRTGFAHLFEHLMFGGSKNIPVYDEPLERAGGQNNAFTNNDITNYYITLPAENVEVGFWLESDRMLELDFSQHRLDVQRNVVIEEYKQRYLNQPYGDAWLLLRPVAYQQHPYRWPTIGRDIQHIEKARLEDVKSFFYQHYAPNNAILTLSGNITHEKAEAYVNKWFADIPAREIKKRKLPVEPRQDKSRVISVERDVSADAIYKVFHMCRRTDNAYYTVDLISDILSNGESSRFNQNLVKEKKYFSNIDAYISGDIDEGLFIITGKLQPEVTMEQAESAILEELDRLKQQKAASREIEKVKNKVEATKKYTYSNALYRAMRLAYHELIWGAEKLNKEIDKYRRVTAEDIMEQSIQIFHENNCSTLYYHAKKQ